MLINTVFILGLHALLKKLFDIVAKLWYGEILSHHYLPLLFSLFRVGLSTHTTNEGTTTIIHHM